MFTGVEAVSSPETQCLKAPSLLLEHRCALSSQGLVLNADDTVQPLVDLGQRLNLLSSSHWKLKTCCSESVKQQVGAETINNDQEVGHRFSPCSESCQSV